ncbi:MAG: hypothetical protein D8M59_05985 [Planctomycetes bacterium]|nr:hypothetical protein [Planctomycetota bacterium]NOG55866.1 hypothetical protein [Planctomycetota bacterium]
MGPSNATGAGPNGGGGGSVRQQFVSLTGVPGAVGEKTGEENLATACLRREHLLIAQVLDCFEHVLRQARGKRRVVKEEFAPFIEFFAEYLDGCHREKEEQCLFRCLVDSFGYSEENGPIQKLVYEHEAGRRRVSIMATHLDDAAAGQRHAVRLFLEQARAFRDILRGHVSAENQGLFEAVDQQIHPGHPEFERLQRSYEQTDQEPDNQTSLSRGQALGRQILEQFASNVK